MAGADIRIKSQLGVGSAFTLRLDLDETLAPEAPHGSRPPLWRNHRARSTPSAKW